MADVRSLPAVEQAAPADRWFTPQLASRALYLAATTMVASMVAISLFFGGAGAFWGPVNDLLVVATVLLLLPAMVVLPRLVRPAVGRWFTYLSALAALGVAVIAAGQLALVAGVITLDTSFLTGGLGVLPVIVWVVATAVPSLGTPLPGRAVGLWALAFLGLIGLIVVVLLAISTDTPTLTSVLGAPLVVVLLGWLVSLGRALARATSPR